MSIERHPITVVDPIDRVVPICQMIKATIKQHHPLPRKRLDEEVVNASELSRLLLKKQVSGWKENPNDRVDRSVDSLRYHI